MLNFVQPGNSITLTATGTVTSGDLIVAGSLIGVAAVDAASGEEYVIDTQGVFELTKKTTDDISVGELLYWDSANSYLTKTPGTDSKPLVGVAVKAAGATATTVYCKLGVHGITGPSA